MPHHWYPRLVLYTLDQSFTSSRHDEVNVPLLCEQRGDFAAGRDGLDERWREGRGG